MADLRTNYVDDILDTSTNERRKYRMITNDDGTVSFVDVTDYSQIGDSFGSNDLNAITNAVNSNSGTIEQLRANLDTVNNKLNNAYSIEIIWIAENASEFPSQTITLSSSISDYDFYEIQCISSNSNDNNRQLRLSTGLIPYNARGKIIDAGSNIVYRANNVPSGTSLEIGDCYVTSTYGTVGTTNNNHLIPWFVYGYKKIK